MQGNYGVRVRVIPMIPFKPYIKKCGHGYLLGKCPACELGRVVPAEPRTYLRLDFGRERNAMEWAALALLQEE